MGQQYRVLLIGAVLSIGVASCGRASETYQYVTSWGSYGSGDGQFCGLLGLCIDASRNVYVTDGELRRVQKFTSDGTYLTKWGTSGSGNGQFAYPTGLAADSSGNIYVTDMDNNRVQKFTSDGVYITQWGANGSGNGQFRSPTGVVVDASSCAVYIADAGNNRVQKFTSDGVYITQWGTPGNGDGQFDTPYGLAVDGSGNVYVVDIYHHRVQKFNSQGIYITQWGSYGVGHGQFSSPIGVAVDGAGRVYVTDLNNSRVQKFASDGTYITQWGTSGRGNGQFYQPRDVAVDALGNVYVGDRVNARVQVFAPSAPAVLTDLTITGPASVWERNGGTDFYTCEAQYEDGSSKDVTAQTSWTAEPTDFDPLDSDYPYAAPAGVLSTGMAGKQLASRQCTVKATYTESGVTVSDSRDVTVKAHKFVVSISQRIHTGDRPIDLTPPWDARPRREWGPWHQYKGTLSFTEDGVAVLGGPWPYKLQDPAKPAPYEHAANMPAPLRKPPLAAKSYIGGYRQMTNAGNWDGIRLEGTGSRTGIHIHRLVSGKHYSEGCFACSYGDQIAQRVRDKSGPLRGNVEIVLAPFDRCRAVDLLVPTSTDITKFRQFVGYGEYVARQEYTLKASLGQSISHTVRVQNDGNQADSFVLRAGRPPVGWGLKVYLGTTEITKWVRSTNGWATGNMPLQQWKDLRVEVTPKSGAQAVPEFDLALTAVATGSSVSDEFHLITDLAGPSGSAVAISGVAAAATPHGSMISFTLAREAAVQTSILNLAGQEVAVLPQVALSAGFNTLLWDGRNKSGAKTPAGQYLVRVNARSRDGSQTQALAPFTVRR